MGDTEKIPIGVNSVIFQGLDMSLQWEVRGLPSQIRDLWVTISGVPERMRKIKVIL